MDPSAFADYDEDADAIPAPGDQLPQAVTDDEDEAAAGKLVPQAVSEEADEGTAEWAGTAAAAKKDGDDGDEDDGVRMHF